MKRWSLYIILTLIGLTYFGAIFAADATCPAPKSKQLTAEEIGTKIQACLDARKKRNESSITEYYCPSGDFTYDDKRILDDNTLPYHIAVALIFAEIDKDALTYMCDLRELRVKAPESWTEDMRKRIELTSSEDNKPFAERYREICKDTYIADRINTKEKKWIDNTETYPQSMCIKLADAKAQAWTNMANILMGQGIAKSWQNEKDTFADKVKGKYVIVYDKYLRYKRIADRAIKGLTALARETIQGGVRKGM